MADWNCPSGLVNVAGQCVPNNVNLAAGYYLFSDEEIERQVAAGETPCGNVDENGNYVGLRPGFMVLGKNEDGSLIKINTCAGNKVDNFLPDAVIVDNAWKPYVKFANVAIIAVLALLILKNLK